MASLADGQKFIKDLILGDFAEKPSSMSVVINGVIGMIPIVDQVLDIRDVSANVLACNKKGWGNLGEEEYANLAFAAIGLIPTAGSFFKGAVKPLWKERKVAGRGVQASIAMMERALGMGKGGVVKWVRALNWAEQTQAAVAKAQAGMAMYIELLTLIRSDPWWATRDMVLAASRLLPGARDAQWYVADTIKKGSKLVETFLNDLLGEHAVMVAAAMQVAQANVQAGKPHSAGKSQAAGSKKATEMRGHEGGKPAAKEKPLNAKHQEVGGQAALQTGQGAGTSKLMQHHTTNFIKEMGSRPMGLVGEHVTDHYVLREHGGTHVHGSTKEQTGGTLVKVNQPKRPVELVDEDLVLMYHSGIDSLWKKPNGTYLVVEAKGRTGATSSNAAPVKSDEGKAKSKIPPVPAGLTPKQAQLWRLLHDNSDKGTGSNMMQMSNDWIKKDLMNPKNLGEKQGRFAKYERRVYLVAQYPETAAGLNDHLEAVTSALLSGAMEHDRHKNTHGVSVVYLEADIAAVEKLRKTKPDSEEKKSSQPTPENQGSNQRSKKAK